jgi:hypothetical protein
MNRDCGRIRGLLSAHLDGELAAADERRVKEHLSECAECRALLGAYREDDVAFLASEATLPEAEWERLAARVDEAVARESLPARQRHGTGREAGTEPAGLRVRWRSLLARMSPRRLSLSALGTLAVAALIILLLPGREEVRVSEKDVEKRAMPELAREGLKKGGGRGPLVLREEGESVPLTQGTFSREQVAEVVQEDRLATAESARQPALVKLRAAREPMPEKVRFEQLKLDANEAIRGGGVEEAIAAAQSLDGFLADAPASDHRLEALELAARVWARLAESDPARHCTEARERVRAWQEAAGDSGSPQLREFLEDFQRGPCAP